MACRQGRCGGLGPGAVTDPARLPLATPPEPGAPWELLRCVVTDRGAEPLRACGHLLLKAGEGLEAGIVDGDLVVALRVRTEVDQPTFVAMEERTVHGELVHMIRSRVSEVVRRERRSSGLDLDRSIGEYIDPAVDAVLPNADLQLAGRGKQGADLAMDPPSVLEARFPLGGGGRRWTFCPPVRGAESQKLRDADGTGRGEGRETIGEPSSQLRVLSDPDAGTPIGFRRRAGLGRGHSRGNPAEYRTVGATPEAAIPRFPVRTR